ncbi:hypothetical protein CA54_40610 [Symmachiella macrocystis]|uniref:Uncharacterized protein n=1 Tax=Symmachiella macrocystis TaxID=2527985 RepID=A0A5C6BEE1_9PLAN|nr:hypothetical protein CA54_40610 [Symmachiella macrocystis]
MVDRHFQDTVTELTDRLVAASRDQVRLRSADSIYKENDVAASCWNGSH